MLSSDNPIVGPRSAKALAAYAAAPEPEPVERRQVDTMIGKLASSLAHRNTSDAEVGLKLESYWIALCDIPHQDLRKAYVDLLRNERWLPEPAVIRKAALAHTGRRLHAKSRAKYLAWKHEMEWTEPTTEFVSAEQLATLRLPAA